MRDSFCAESVVEQAVDSTYSATPALFDNNRREQRMPGEETHDPAAFVMPHQPGDPEMPDDDFEPDYLRRLHPMPWFDDHVRMNRERHKYVLDGVELPTSTTGHMKAYVGEFNAEAKSVEIAARLRDYEKRRDSGVTRVEPEWLIAQYARYGHCRTAEDIRKEWDITRDKGTFMHRLIELYYNRVFEGELARHSALNTREFQQFLRFDAKHVRACGYAPFRTEFTMYRYEIGGQIDMLYQHVDDANATDDRRFRLWMVDWKRKFELGDHGEPLRAPFADMPPGDRTKFTIQLNTYKAMIEATTPYRIVRMTVLLAHPDMPDYYMEELADIGPQIATMFENRRQALIEEKCAKASDILLSQMSRRIDDASDRSRGEALTRALRLVEGALRFATPSAPPAPPAAPAPALGAGENSMSVDEEELII